MMSRARKFVAVERYYRQLHAGMEESGAGLYRMTSRGAWATSRAPHIFYFFRSIDLSRYRLFLDLGSGDGIVTCIAGLFTRSIGIEVDQDLCRIAQQAGRLFHSNGQVSFICGDYLTQRIERADCLYIYPDKPSYGVEELLHNWKGALLVYGPHLPARRLVPARRLECGNERLVLYKAPP